MSLCFFYLSSILRQSAKCTIIVLITRSSIKNDSFILTKLPSISCLDLDSHSSVGNSVICTISISVKNAIFLSLSWKMSNGSRCSCKKDHLPRMFLARGIFSLSLLISLIISRKLTSQCSSLAYTSNLFIFFTLPTPCI